MVSPQVKARFPTLDHLVDSGDETDSISHNYFSQITVINLWFAKRKDIWFIGFLLPHEKIIIEHLNQKTDHPKYW